MHRLPRPAPSITAPFLSKIANCIPKKGFPTEPALSALAPGIGVTAIPPVSVYHHVSTIGHLPPPITSKYHYQTVGFIGSPTVPRSFKEVLLVFLIISSPSFMSDRRTVGAV